MDLVSEPALVAAFIKYKELLALDFVKPAYFPGALSYIVKVCKAYHEQTGEIINRLRGIVLHSSIPCPAEFEPVLWDTVQAVEGMTETLFGGAEINIDYMRDALHTFCTKQSLELLSEQIKRANPERALGLIRSYNKPTIQSRDGNSLFDAPALQSAYEEPPEVLLEYNGTLGVSVGPIRREDFLLFAAPVKRGKSWWLLYSALQSMRQGHKVLYFNLEMPHKDVLKRSWQIFTGTASMIDTRTKLPSFTLDNNIEYKDIEAPFSYPTDQKVAKMKKHLQMNSPGGDLEIITIPPDQCSLNHIRDKWNQKLHEGYVADVIVVDYLDLMAGSGNLSREYRDQVNSIYLGFRSLLLELHVLGISASQTGRQTFDGLKTTEMSDVAEDIRKTAHATTILTLTQSTKDLENMIMRVKTAGSRNHAGGRTCCVIYNYALGRVCIDSMWESLFTKKKED